MKKRTPITQIPNSPLYYGAALRMLIDNRLSGNFGQFSYSADIKASQKHSLHNFLENHLWYENLDNSVIQNLPKACGCNSLEEIIPAANQYSAGFEESYIVGATAYMQRRAKRITQSKAADDMNVPLDDIRHFENGYWSLIKNKTNLSKLENKLPKYLDFESWEKAITDIIESENQTKFSEILKPRGRHRHNPGTENNVPKQLQTKNPTPLISQLNFVQLGDRLKELQERGRK